MFEHLRRLLHETRERAPPASPAEAQQLAAAVLLLEVARADYEHHTLERAALRDSLAREFGLAPETLDALLVEAEQRAQHAVSLYEFVQTLNRTMSPEQKRALLHRLWEVAHADGRVDPHEEHLLRRIADLLHLSHADFIGGKLATAPKPAP